MVAAASPSAPPGAGKKTAAKDPSVPRLVKDVKIKAGMPSVEEARKQLLHELRNAKREGFAMVRLIHGYGSTGVGGKLKDALRSSLARRRNEDQIKGFICGEKFGTFDSTSRELLATFPELQRDPDYNNGNEGITLVVL